MKPTDAISGTISALGSAGDGIVAEAGRKAFVPYALPGEGIDHGWLARASDSRVEPPCPHHGNVGRSGCGGCRMQHLAIDAYETWKHGLAADALAWAGIASPAVERLQMSPVRSRRRAALTAERQGGRLRIGFNRRGTHQIIDLSTCLILRPELFALLEPLRQLPWLREGERAGVILTQLGQATDMLIERQRDLDLGEREALATFAPVHGIARVSWRPDPRSASEPVCDRAPFTAGFGGYRVPIPPGGFLQATEEGEAALVAVMRQALPPVARTIDLFAGSGTFTFPALAHGPVRAVEANPDACASIAAVAAPGCTAERRDLFNDPVMDFAAYDAAIIDPPYAGAEAQCTALARNGPRTIVMVSCNPMTFTRDAAILGRGGYRADRVVAVDQFRWSAELEMVAVMHRNE